VLNSLRFLRNARGSTCKRRSKYLRRCRVRSSTQRTQHRAFPARNPSKQHALHCAENGTQPEDGKRQASFMASFGRVACHGDSNGTRTRLAITTKKPLRSAKNARVSAGPTIFNAVSPDEKSCRTSTRLPAFNSASTSRCDFRAIPDPFRHETRTIPHRSPSYAPAPQPAAPCRQSGRAIRDRLSARNA
jgi:hypothetical protein